LIVANRRALGWLTDQHPDAPGEVVLILDANLSRPFRATDLAPDHLIELHGARESMRDVLLAAGEAGFTVGWPADDPFPAPSRN